MEVEQLKSVVKDSLAPVVERLDATDARLKAIEDSPLIKTPAIIVSQKEIHGRKIAKQGRWFRSQIKDEQLCDGLVKFLIGVALRKTTMNETTDAQGAYLVPDEYAQTMVELATQSSFALQVANVINMGSDVMKVPVELTRGSASWVAEGSEKSGSEPTFDQATLTAKTLVNLAVATNQLIADSDFDISSLLARQFAYTQAQELDAQMFSGTGDPVSGIVTAKAGYSAVITGISFSGVTATDLSLAIAKLAEGRLAGARFFLNRMASHYVRSLKATDGTLIFAPMTGNQPANLWGFPMNVTENIATTDGTGKPFGVFGNFNYFLLGRRAGSMMIEADPYTRFAFNETRFRMVSRWAMNYGDVNSFCRIING